MGTRGLRAVVIAVLALGGSLNAALQTPKPGAQLESVPPLSFTCPMHPEIVEDKKGSCPICRMDLVGIRLDSVWTCGTRPLAVIESKPGRCPIDGTPLVQVTAAVSWTCPGSDKESLSPGTCADGSPMQKKFSPRAHGNHNPQHGGQFFMAADNWHHLEGTYLSSGVFRMHFYDDFTKPLPPAQVRAIKAEVVVKDPKSGQEKRVPLVRSGRYVQATIGKLPLPAPMYAHVQFKPDGPHNRFDFTFESYSKEPTAAPASGSSDLSSGVDPALVPLPIPDTVPEMLAQLRTRTDQIRAIIDKGSFASIYVPAFQAKDLALALDARKDTLTPEKRKIAEPAITKLVRSAWLLDAFGDIGNKQQITEAYAKFVEAAKDIQAAFPSQP